MPQGRPQPWAPPAPPSEPQKEGARWRFHRPSSEAVAEWFGTQPLDEGMEHEHYVGGVVLIPQNEKVKYTRPDGGGLTERYEQVFTPYVQIGTRVAYARRLAEYRGLIYKAEPADVPRSTNPQSLYFNGNMDAGLWWHVVQGDRDAVRYLCATYVVRFYEPTSYRAKIAGENPTPVLEGRGTKQVGGGPDINGIMKAQTGAIGRALGVAGILAVGTGIATAEDMQEFQGPPMTAPSDTAQLPAPPELPEGAAPVPQSPEEAVAALRAREAELETRLQEEKPETWRRFTAWWQERSRESGWSSINDVPFEALKGIVSRMEREYAAPTAQ